MYNNKVVIKLIRHVIKLRKILRFRPISDLKRSVKKMIKKDPSHLNILSTAENKINMDLFDFFIES